jgi:hypothetical protein
MTTLKLTPYLKIIEEDYDDVKINLKEKSFKNVKYQEGRIVFYFQSCFFKKLTIENSEEIEFRDISFSFDHCFFGELIIQNIVTKNITIHLYSSLCRERTFIHNVSNISVNNSFLNNIFLRDNETVRVSYTTENIFPFFWSKLLRKLSLKNISCVLCEPQYYSIENCSKINFTSSRKENDGIGLYKIPYNTKKEYGLGYKLNAEEEKLIQIKITIKYGEDFVDDSTSINNINLFSLSLSGTPSGKISVDNSNIGSLYISEFFPKQEVGFYNISPINYFKEKSKISIHKSNLDNVWFDNVYFTGYERLSFFRTAFSKTIFTACDFPDDYNKFIPIENVHYPENKGENFHKDQYEIFLQLKKALETTGNNYEALKLHSVSHDALKNIKTITFWDKFILSVNSCSNAHGMSIKKPFVLFIIFSIFLYILYLISLGRISFQESIDWDLFGYYFLFIDLTHRADFLVTKDEYNFLSLFIDYFSKISTSFFIFQFVSAFRKYGKK